MNAKSNGGWPNANLKKPSLFHIHIVIRDGISLAADRLDAHNLETAVIQVLHIFPHRLVKIVFKLRRSSRGRKEPSIDPISGNLTGRHGPQLNEGRSGHRTD